MKNKEKKGTEDTKISMQLQHNIARSSISSEDTMRAGALQQIYSKQELDEIKSLQKGHQAVSLELAKTGRSGPRIIVEGPIHLTSATETSCAAETAELVEGGVESDSESGEVMYINDKEEGIAKEQVKGMTDTKAQRMADTTRASHNDHDLFAIIMGDVGDV